MLYFDYFRFTSKEAKKYSVENLSYSKELDDLESEIAFIRRQLIQQYKVNLFFKNSLKVIMQRH